MIWGTVPPFPGNLTCWTTFLMIELSSTRLQLEQSLTGVYPPNIHLSRCWWYPHSCWTISTKISGPLWKDQHSDTMNFWNGSEFVWEDLWTPLGFHLLVFPDISQPFDGSEKHAIHIWLLNCNSGLGRVPFTKMRVYCLKFSACCYSPRFQICPFKMVWKVFDLDGFHKFSRFSTDSSIILTPPTSWHRVPQTRLGSRRFQVCGWNICWSRVPKPSCVGLLVARNMAMA